MTDGAGVKSTKFIVTIYRCGPSLAVNDNAGGRTQTSARGKGEGQANADKGKGVTNYHSAMTQHAEASDAHPTTMFSLEDFCQRPFHSATIIRAFDVYIYFSFKISTSRRK